MKFETECTVKWCQQPIVQIAGCSRTE